MRLKTGRGDPSTQLAVEELFQFEVDAFARRAAVALAARKERACFLGRFGFRAPFLKSGDLHRRVERFQLRLLQWSVHGKASESLYFR